MNFIKYNSLFKLNEEEKQELQHKMDVIREVKKLFNDGLYIDSEIFNNFPLKEILTDDPVFLEFVKEITSSEKLPAIFFQKYLPLSNENDYTDEEKIIYGYRLLEIYKNNIDSYDINVIFNAVRKYLINVDNAEEFLITLYENNKEVLEKITGTNLKEFLEYVISKAKIRESNSLPLKLMDIIDSIFKSQSYGNFREYPMIILNPNVSREARIQVISKKFVIKDLPMYIDALGKAVIEDFEPLNDFLEAVVFKNNRVREKEKLLADIFRRIFFNRTSYIRFNENVNGVKEFVDKYKEYFLDESFFNDRIISCTNSSYKSQQNVFSFVNTILIKYLDNTEVCKIISYFLKNKNKIAYMYSLDRSMYKLVDTALIKLLENNDYENLEKSLDMILINEKSKDRNIRSIYYLNKVLFEFNFMKRMNEMSYDENDTCRKVKKYFKELLETIRITKENCNVHIDDCQALLDSSDIDSFLRRNIVYEEDLAKLGISDGDRTSSYYIQSTATDVLLAYTDNANRILEKSILEESDTFKDESFIKYANTFVSKFENEENCKIAFETISDFMNKHSSFYSNYTQIKLAAGVGRSYETRDVLILLLNNIENSIYLVKKVAEKRNIKLEFDIETVIANMNKITDLVKLVSEF